MPTPPWESNNNSNTTIHSSPTASYSGSIDLCSVLRNSSSFTNPEVLPDLIHYYNINPWTSNFSQVTKKFKWNFENPNDKEDRKSSRNHNVQSNHAISDEIDDIWFYDDIRVEQNIKWANERVIKGVKMAKRNDIKSIDDAMRYFSQALEQVPNHANALVGRGCLYANSGKFEKAIDDFKLALKTTPSHENAQKYLNAVLTKMKHQQSLSRLSSSHASSSSSRNPPPPPPPRHVTSSHSSAHGISSSSTSSSTAAPGAAYSTTNSSSKYQSSGNNLDSKSNNSKADKTSSSSMDISDRNALLTAVDLRRLLNKKDDSDDDDDDDDSRQSDEDNEDERQKRSSKKHKKSKKKKSKKEKKHKKDKKRSRSERSSDSDTGRRDEEEQGDEEHPILSRTRHKFWG